MMYRPLVAVIGPAGGEAPEPICALAGEVGRLLAQRGFAVLTGGLDGVMSAAARGVADAGGVAIGLLPGDDRAGASEHLTVALTTGLGQARNAVVVRSADGIIAVGGSWGTLSEIALARRTGIPVVCLRGWRIADEAGTPLALDVADSPADAVEAIAAALERDG